MRLKILSLFVAIQMLSFGLWTTFLRPAEAANSQTAQLPSIHAASSGISASVLDSQKPAVSVSFSTRNMEDGKRFLNSIKTNQIETALKKLPVEHAASVKKIILDYSEKANRGLGGNSMIILRAVNMDAEEMIGVLIHEIGHNVDYAALAPVKEEKKSAFKDGDLTLYETDPSLDFYRVSWASTDTRKKTAINTDFVSGYAMTDPFEDFAETYAYYVLHNKDFKVLAATSDALHAKYEFMKYRVFNEVEFDTGDGLVKAENRPWDVTVLSYDINQFLN